MAGLFAKKNQILMIITLVILSVLLIAYVLRPSIIGYNAYKKIKSSNYSIEDYGKDVQELKTRVLISNANFSTCNEFNKKILTELEKYLDKSSECKGELNALKINFSLTKSKYEESAKELKAYLDENSKEIENIKGEKNEEINKLKNEKDIEINDLKLQYSLFAQNTANNLCCKAKVDNSKINYYKIENNKVTCLEEGTLPISC